MSNISEANFCIKTICPEISAVIQKKLFSLDYKWMSGSKSFENYSEDYIEINTKDKTLSFWRKGLVRKKEGEEISLSELMSWTNDRVVRLNDAYEAHIYTDGIRINPWAENAWIPFDRFITLAEALEEVKKGIDDEPFAIDTICPEISKVVQKELFGRGCEWSSGGKNVIHADQRILAIHHRNKNIITHGDAPELKRLSLEEFFSQSKKEVSVTLTDSWTAVVTKDQVKVGCQTFDIKKVEELISACRELGKI